MTIENHIPEGLGITSIKVAIEELKNRRKTEQKPYRNPHLPEELGIISVEDYLKELGKKYGIEF